MAALAGFVVCLLFLLLLAFAASYPIFAPPPRASDAYFYEHPYFHSGGGRDRD